MADERLQTGGCLCGGVRYRTRGELRGVIACHCEQCRRTSGHYHAMTSVDSDALELLEAATLAWYRSSDAAERGFCRVCGGNLFWRPFVGRATSITAGSLDVPTGVRMALHIYVADKSDYYDLNDDLPKKDAWT